MRKHWKKIIALVIPVAFAAGVGLNSDQTLSISKEEVGKQFVSSTFVTKYKAEGGSFREVLNSKQSEKLEARIGNETADVFDPALEIKRWDGRASLRVNPKLKDVVADKDKAINFVGDKVEFRNGTNEAIQMYDLPDSTTTPEGGYEIEWVLNSKPLDNFFDFDINLTGIDCTYQPELTQQEKDEGGNRPDNVIGSYACYYSESGDYSKMGDNNYRAGKAFHIYRPKAVDADGAWTWGTLDLKDNVLTVTVPQDFLDKAVYPVKVDPTFGYTNIGATTGSVAINVIRGEKAISTATGTIDSISAYFYTNSSSYTASSFKAVMVASSTLTILSNGVGGTTTNTTTPAWYTTSNYITPPTITNGSTYYICIIGTIIGGSPSFNGRYDTGGNATENIIDSTNDYTTPTDPTDATFAARKYSIYATFTYATFTYPTEVIINGNIILNGSRIIK